MNLFLITPPENNIARIEGDEYKHAVRVLRTDLGQEIIATDGRGFMYQVVLKDKQKNFGLVEVVNKVENWGEHPYDISLFVSVLRLPDRLETLFEKAVELGATNIIPFISERTVKPKIRLDRMHRIMEAAMKQCLRSRLPRLAEPLEFSDLTGKFPGLNIMGWCEAQKPLRDLSHEIEIHPKINLWIGPEGDFTPAEVNLATEKGFHLVSMGENRLRTETAGIYALSTLKFIKGW